METMTLHRALAEIKLLDKKIAKAIRTLEATGLRQGSLLVNKSKTVADFEKDAKAIFQSIKSMIERKEKIKSAITRKNTETIVTVAGNSMSIADAINRKNNIEQHKMVVNTLRNSYSDSTLHMENRNRLVEERAIDIAKTALQKDHVKIGDNDAVAITKPFVDANKYHLVDPLKASETAEILDNEIAEFEAEIDAVLSEANAMTTLEI